MKSDYEPKSAQVTLVLLIHLPDACRILSRDVLPSNTSSHKISVTSHADDAYLLIPPSRYPQDHGQHPMFVRPSFAPHPGSIDLTSLVPPRLRSPLIASSRTSLWHFERWEMYVVMVHLLNLPCLICFVARASTESTSTIIFTIMSVIIVVGGIVV